MKKTIAILLILVIGMVGVFAEAASQSKELHLKTVVAPINQMAVSSTDQFEWTTTGDNPTGYFYSEYGTSATAFDTITDSDHYTITGSRIAYLHAQSNNRGGVTLKMQATPLANNTQYIDYTVTVVKDGSSSNPSSTKGADNGAEVTIATLAYQNVLIEYLGEIFLKLDESLANAADGTYVGSITFSFTAS